MNTMTYKGYLGSVAFSEKDNVFFGKIEGIKLQRHAQRQADTRHPPSDCHACPSGRHDAECVYQECIGRES